MSDCPNAEIRDLLPDLLHDRLDAPTRARVVAHVDGCADCRAELELLRSMRGALERGTPRIDVGRVAAALPSPRRARPEPARRRPAWADWRIAATVTLLAAGGTSLAVMRTLRDDGESPTESPAMVTAHQDSARVAPVAPVIPNAVASGGSRTSDTAPKSAIDSRHTSPPPVHRASPQSPAPTEVASADEQGGDLAPSRVSDLSAKQLKALLTDIDHMEATPITEPEPVTLRVSTRATSPSGL